VGGKWIVEMFEHLTDNPQIIVDGFRHAGVFDALGILDDDDDDDVLPDYNNNDQDSDLDEEDGSDDTSDEDIVDTIERLGINCVQLLNHLIVNQMIP